MSDCQFGRWKQVFTFATRSYTAQILGKGENHHQNFVQLASLSAPKMATPKEEASSISGLSINEIRTNDLENVHDAVVLGVNKDEQTDETIVDQQNDKICALCRQDMTKMLYEACQGGINIYENNEIVNITVSTASCRHCEAEAKSSETNPNRQSESGAMVKQCNDAGNPTFNINVYGNTGTIFIGDGLNYGLAFIVDERAMRWLQRFYRITNEIYPLRDNGKWDEFYEKVDKVKTRPKLDDVSIFMMIEKSVALRFQGKNSQAKKIVKEAMKMIFKTPGLQMREFLIALSHCQRAALYRKDSRLSEANDAVDIAEQNVAVLPCILARAYMDYEKASNLYIQHSYLYQSGKARDECAELAKKELKNCISTCERMLSENDTIYLRRHILCLVKLAHLNLDCVTTEARNQPVSEACVREAGDCITKIKQQIDIEQMGECSAMLLHSAESGYHYRRGDYTKATICAQQALDKAKSLGFQSHVDEEQERVRHMADLLKQQQEQRKQNQAL